MTVGELKKLLEKEDDNRIVIMSKDAEGNNHSPLSDFWQGKYRAETTWYGEVGLEKLEEGYDEDDIMEDGELALILCPIN